MAAVSSLSSASWSAGDTAADRASISVGAKLKTKRRRRRQRRSSSGGGESEPASPADERHVARIKSRNYILDAFGKDTLDVEARARELARQQAEAEE